jgi:hypothetical protein
MRTPYRKRDCKSYKLIAETKALKSRNENCPRLYPGAGSALEYKI